MHLDQKIKKVSMFISHYLLSCTCYLEWLYKCPKQNTDGVALAQQLDKTSSSEQTKEAQAYEIILKEKKELKD